MTFYVFIPENSSEFIAVLLSSLYLCLKRDLFTVWQLTDLIRSHIFHFIFIFMIAFKITEIFVHVS
jgi:hypothetical protein